MKEVVIVATRKAEANRVVASFNDDHFRPAKDTFRLTPKHKKDKGGTPDTRVDLLKAIFF